MIPLTEPIHYVLFAIVIIGSGMVGYAIGHGRGWNAATSWVGCWHARTIARLFQQGIVDDKFDKIYVDEMRACRDYAYQEHQESHR